MEKRGKFEKLTHVQLQQKVIHLESELSFIRTNRERRDRKCLERVNLLEQENDRLKIEFQEVVNEKVEYSREIKALIKDYNELLMKNTADQNKILQLERSIGLGEFEEKIESLSSENDMLVKLVKDLKKEAELLRGDVEKHLTEKQIYESEMEQFKKELSSLEEANEEMHRLTIKERELVESELTQMENACNLYQEKEIALIMQIEKGEADLIEAQNEISQINKENTDLKQELEKKNIVLNNKTIENQKKDQDLQFLKQKNEAYLQKISKLEEYKNAALESEGHLKTEILNVKSQLMGSEKVKNEMLILLKEQENEVGRLKEENNRFVEEKTVLLNKLAQLEKELIQSENNHTIYQEKESTLIMKMGKVEADLIKAQKEILKINKEKTDMEQELKNKIMILDDIMIQNQKMGQNLQVLKEKEAHLQQKSVSYLQKITQLETDKNTMLESESHLKTEIFNAKSQLMELEKVKTEVLNHLRERESEIGKLMEENNQFIEEKTILLNKLSKLEDENSSFHETVSILSVQRQSDDKRMDHITANLNEVFTETKQLVRMTSSLKHQLEAKTIEINKLKKEKKMLMQEVVQLKDDYEKAESRKNELEDQIEIMRSELMKAQNSLSRLEQFETDKLKLKEDLETKIDEFNMLTDHYQREKESYLHVLEHVQDQVNVYKEKSDQFDAEKGSWSKQIDNLKSELIQTKASIVKMEELEQKNVELAAEIQAKEIEIYKIKKDSERALQHQMEQFKAELKLYQDKISQYEKDREIWENQMKQMKAQFAGFESSLEEKENFIKQYISQPLSSAASKVQPVHQSNSQSQQSSFIQQNSTPLQPSPQQSTQQSTDWFQRMASQQQGLSQVVQNNQNSNTTTMDFFTLRRKTTQPSIPPGPVYGSQWKQD